MIEDIAYVSGVLCGGGTVETKHNFFIRVKTKDGLLARIVYDRMKRFSNKTRLYSKNGDYMVILRQKNIVQYFVDKCGIKFTRYDWRVPVFVEKNIKYTKEFLRGVFDRACMVYNSYAKSGKRKKRRRVLRIASVNKNGLDDVSRLLEKIGVKSIVYPTGSCFYLDVHGSYNIKKFLDEVGFYHTEKLKKADINYIL